MIRLVIPLYNKINGMFDFLPKQRDGKTHGRRTIEESVPGTKREFSKIVLTEHDVMTIVFVSMSFHARRSAHVSRKTILSLTPDLYFKKNTRSVLRAFWCLMDWARAPYNMAALKTDGLRFIPDIISYTHRYAPRAKGYYTALILPGRSVDPCIS